LFGSHARGEDTADSDIDWLVIFSELSNPRELTITTRTALPSANPLKVSAKRQQSQRDELDVLFSKGQANDSNG
jgi:predicted nucleotidyltransferase